jgi:hypothetical protein
MTGKEFGCLEVSGASTAKVLEVDCYRSRLDRSDRLLSGLNKGNRATGLLDFGAEFAQSSLALGSGVFREETRTLETRFIYPPPRSLVTLNLDAKVVYTGLNCKRNLN